MKIFILIMLLATSSCNASTTGKIQFSPINTDVGVEKSDEVLKLEGMALGEKLSSELIKEYSLKLEQSLFTEKNEKNYGKTVDDFYGNKARTWVHFSSLLGEFYLRRIMIRSFFDDPNRARDNYQTIISGLVADYGKPSSSDDNATWYKNSFYNSSFTWEKDSTTISIFLKISEDGKVAAIVLDAYENAFKGRHVIRILSEKTIKWASENKLIN